MICKHCGMESTTTDRCSLCGQPLTSAGEEEVLPQSETPPSDVTVETVAPMPSQERISPSAAAKSGGVKPPAPAMMPRNAGPTLRMPAPFMPPARTDRPTFSPPLTPPVAPGEPSSPRFTLAGEPLEAAETPVGNDASLPLVESQNPVSNSIPAVDMSPPPPAFIPETDEPAVARQPLPSNLGGLVGSQVRPDDSKSDDDDDKTVPLPSARALLMRFVGIFIPILIVAGTIAHFAPGLFWAPLLLAQFAGGLLLPVLRVVPWADEDSDDLIYFALLTLVFGPLISLVIYGVIGLIRQNANPALVGCMTVAALSWFTVMAATGNTSTPANLSGTMPFINTGGLNGTLVEHLLLTWSGFIAIAGWYTAGIFHKLDE